jgi:hypothetical protein
MSSKLPSLVRLRFGETLSQEEARQLIFLIFCTVDWLPDDLRKEEWSRSTLSIEFAALSKEGFIRNTTPDQRETGYWNAIIDDFMFKRIDVDRQFSDAISHEMKTTEPSQALQTMRLKLPVNSIAQGQHV